MSPENASRRRCPAELLVPIKRLLPSLENSSLVQSREMGDVMPPWLLLFPPVPLSRLDCVALRTCG